MSGPRQCAILLAGGVGRRAGGPKQFRRAGAHSLLYHAALPFLELRELGGLLLVVPAGHEREVREEFEGAGVRRLVGVVAGGATRNHSSRRGLEALPASCTTLLIHDAARPFATPELIRRVLRAARAHGAAVPVLPVHDSVVDVGRAGRLGNYLDRSRLRAVQTPQGFRREILQRAFERQRGRAFTDDAGVLRAAGLPVHLVEGEPGNRKITTPHELEAALRRLEEEA